MSCKGECYVVLPSNSAATVFLGRNAQAAASTESSVGVAQEVIYYAADEVLQGSSDGGAAVDAKDPSYKVILQKPHAAVWGGDCGANEQNVAMAVAFSDEPENGGGHLNAADMVRICLATSASASAAVDSLGALIAVHASESSKYNFVICDTAESWSVSSAAKLWAAQCFKEGFNSVGSNGLSVTSCIDKSSDGLADALKTLGHWNGEGDMNFAECFDCLADEPKWHESEPTAGFCLNSMFETLRAAADVSTARSATIFVLNSAGICSHWFTATPNANESVFKPFVFAPNPKISPLTKAHDGQQGVTLLHKLHAQRKPAAIEKLKNLEANCVEEMQKYFGEHDAADEELDELLKDCVEAEVKFYR